MAEKWAEARRIADAIDKHGQIIISPVSGSMYPLIREQRDSVVLEKPAFPLKKYDVALYERASGMLVLHRVIEAEGHDYVFSGDHYAQRETGVTDEQICGVMVGFFRREKYTSVDAPLYKLYCRTWCAAFWPRKLTGAVWAAVKKLTGAVKAPF